VKNVLSPLLSKGQRSEEAKANINRRKSMPNILTTATKQKSTESTKYDDNTTATMKRVDVPTMTEPMSPRSTTATTSENLKENINIKVSNCIFNYCILFFLLYADHRHTAHKVAKS